MSLKTISSFHNCYANVKFYIGYYTNKQISDHLTKRMVPVGNGYVHENESFVATTTTTISSVTTITAQSATTTNNVGKGLVEMYHTTKRSRRKNYQSTQRCKLLVFVDFNSFLCFWFVLSFHLLILLPFTVSC